MESNLFLTWLIGGAVLMALEFIVPGGIVFFLGLGGTLVALLIYFGLIDGWVAAFTTWFIGSLVLVFSLRGVVQKFVPAEVEKTNTDEDVDAYGQLAEVCETIGVNDEGRIMFRGSTWVARNVHSEHALAVGTKVRIVFRDNLVWMVEDVASSESEQS